MNEDAEYVCDTCGEVIVIPVDATEGAHQTLVEDCPVCCRPNEIRIDLDADGSVIGCAGRGL